MTYYHIKLGETSSFKPVTRKTPFLCRLENPATGAYVVVSKDRLETADEVIARIKRLDPNGDLCNACAVKL
jgi:hypothetical protein